MVEPVAHVRAEAGVRGGGGGGGGRRWLGGVVGEAKEGTGRSGRGRREPRGLSRCRKDVDHHLHHRIYYCLCLPFCNWLRNCLTRPLGTSDIYTLFILAVKQSAQVDKLLVGDVLVVDADALTLSTEEVGGVDGACTAAIDCIKALPAPTSCLISIAL